MALATLTSNSTSVSMVTALDTISTPILTQTTASAVASTEPSKLDDLSSSLDSNMLIYASAASGCAALLGVSALLVYKRRRNKRQLKLPAKVVQNSFQGMEKSQLSGNLYLGGRSAPPYAPNTGHMYRPTNGMQTTGGPTMSQSMSRTGWTSFPSGPEGLYPEPGPGIGNSLNAAQIFQVPTMFNPTTIARLPISNTFISGGAINAPNQSLFTFTDTMKPRTNGNTITVVPKFTMRF